MNRPYIGMTKEKYNNLLLYCQKENIVKFGNGQVYTKDEMIKKFSKAKKIYIVSTTGAGLIKTLKEEAIVKALQNKAQINILLPDKDSEFCKNVAESECCRKGYNLVISEQNRYRIESEFVATIQYLNEAFCSAKKEYGKKNIGSICCYSTQNLLRQTIVLVISETNTSWGWINMTMSPLRTADTPSIAFCDNNVDKGLDSLIQKHCECLMRMASKKHAIRKINGKTTAEKLEYSDHEKYWILKKKKAFAYMKMRELSFSKILIEVAAQHPLKDGKYPNHEFQKRLDFAVFLYHKIGFEHVWLYVPGSIHKHNDIVDNISLSQAGKDYLIKQGVDENHIFADDANLKYKGENGVYNSADESYVASRIFMDNNFGRLICVCSPYQTMRKTFYYMEFGLMPECYGIPDMTMFHDAVSEFFGSLHYTVYEDHNWQNDNSDIFQNSRKERKPD